MCACLSGCCLISRIGLLMLKIAAIACLCLLLTGCVTISPTLEKPNSPSASVRFAVVKGTNASIQKVSNSSCDSEPEEWIANMGIQLAADYGHGRRVGMPLSQGFNPKLMTEIKVEANRPYSFEIRGFLPSSIPTSAPHCRQIVTFMPEPDGLYEVLFSLTPPSCSVRAVRLDQDSKGTYARTPLESARITDGCKQRFMW